MEESKCSTKIPYLNLGNHMMMTAWGCWFWTWKVHQRSSKKDGSGLIRSDLKSICALSDTSICQMSKICWSGSAVFEVKLIVKCALRPPFDLGSQHYTSQQIWSIGTSHHIIFIFINILYIFDTNHNFIMIIWSCYRKWSSENGEDIWSVIFKNGIFCIDM